MTKYYVPDGLKCSYCGVVFARDDPLEAHPPSLEYINGYPSPCRKIGKNINSDWFIRDNYAWVMANIRFVGETW